jgi:hypothetical protein
VLLASSALALGFLHGLGADHLMAIAALSSAPGESAAGARRRALIVATRFACGHALLLAAGAAAALFLGWQIPALVEQAGEVAAGVVLVALGAVALWVVATGRVYAHRHQHGVPAHVHWHLHLGRPSHHPQPSAHSHVPMVVGALFAVSGLRALTTIAPIAGASGAAMPSIAAVGVAIITFACGILCSMCLFGIALSRVLSTHLAVRLGRAAAAVTGAASLALGLYWIAGVVG